MKSMSSNGGDNILNEKTKKYTHMNNDEDMMCRKRGFLLLLGGRFIKRGRHIVFQSLATVIVPVRTNDVFLMLTEMKQ